MIWSSQYDDSEWCKQEFATLEVKQNAKKGFRYVIGRVDETDLPGFASAKLWIDFSQQREGPGGGRTALSALRLAGASTAARGRQARGSTRPRERPIANRTVSPPGASPDAPGGVVSTSDLPRTVRGQKRHGLATAARPDQAETPCPANGPRPEQFGVSLSGRVLLAPSGRSRNPFRFPPCGDAR